MYLIAEELLAVRSIVIPDLFKCCPSSWCMAVCFCNNAVQFTPTLRAVMDHPSQSCKVVVLIIVQSSNGYIGRCKCMWNKLFCVYCMHKISWLTCLLLCRAKLFHQYVFLTVLELLLQLLSGWWQLWNREFGLWLNPLASFSWCEWYSSLSCIL